jgi:RNA polymerase sigma-70 factor (ECF subfamily)
VRTKEGGLAGEKAFPEKRCEGGVGFAWVNSSEPTFQRKAENSAGKRGVLVVLWIEARCGGTVSDESVPLALPLLRLAAGTSEVTALYRELRKPLLRYLVCLGLSSDEAQDVVQESFLSLQRHLSGGGEQGNIRGWIFRVAHNEARNRQTSYQRRLGEPLDGDMEFLANDATPEETLLEKEKLRRLAAGMRMLSEPERECVLLRAEGLRYREIGEVLGMATSTVGDTVERAIQKLAKHCG